MRRPHLAIPEERVTPSDGPSSQEIDFPALQPDEPQKAHRSLRERLGSLGKVRD
jgi:hypothetical protein